MLTMRNISVVLIATVLTALGGCCAPTASATLHMADLRGKPAAGYFVKVAAVRGSIFSPCGQTDGGVLDSRGDITLTVSKGVPLTLTVYPVATGKKIGSANLAYPENIWRIFAAVDQDAALSQRPAGVPQRDPTRMLGPELGMNPTVKVGDRTLFLVTLYADKTLDEELAIFRSLKLGMSLEQIDARLGPPDDDIGSGISHEIYRLRDGSEALVIWGGELDAVYHNNKSLLPAEGARR